MTTGAARADDGLAAWEESAGPDHRAEDRTATAPERPTATPHLVAVPAPASDLARVAAVAAAGTEVEPAEDPADIAGALARCVAEVLSGVRDLDTIARWITDEVHRHLLQRVAVAARARSAARKPVGRPVFHVGGVVLDRSRGDVVEAAVVVHTRNRARAVSIRLEVHGGRWRATSIAVL